MSDMICCLSNMTEHIITSFQGNVYCMGQAVSDPCGTNMLCASGACVNGICCLNSACRFEMFNMMSDMICCPSNMTEHIITNFQGNFYCTGQAVGNPCGTNMLCASGGCVNGICIAAKNQVDGELCDDNDDCLNSTCGFEMLNMTSDMICCPSNMIECIITNFQGNFYCTGQVLVGNPCGTNMVCASGACVNGICRAAKNQVDGELCDDDDDCLNSLCGFKMFNTTSDMICCPSNMTEHIITNFQGNFYCTGQVVGNPCGTNMVCASGACVNGIC